MKPKLIAPHGGKLIDQIVPEKIKEQTLNYAKKFTPFVLSEELVMDVDKIAIGAYSPLQGFMSKKDLDSVLSRMRLINHIPWTIPIILDIPDKLALQVKKGSKLALYQAKLKNPFAILNIEDKYPTNKKEIAKKTFSTLDKNHPGVQKIFNLNPTLLGGKIDLINRPHFPFSRFEMTPQETRVYFIQKGWSKIVGFHTRNAIHRAHEYLQRCALEIADGLLVHPVVGKKKSGDFTAGAIIKSYQTMMKYYYSSDRALFSVVSIYSRYAGPREAIFTAILRKNYGCSHFIVGRDHTGVGEYYDVYASHRIFDKFTPQELGIIPLCFHEPVWCDKCQHLTTEKTCSHSNHYQKISGTLIRELLSKKKKIPPTMMRPEITAALIQYSKNKSLFV